MMKLLTLIICVIGFTFSCFSEYFTYYEPGLSRLYKNSKFWDSEYEPTYYERICVNSCVQNDIMCYQVIKRTYTHYPYVYQDGTPYDVYENDGEVYIYIEGIHKLLLLNFSLNLGDHLSLNDVCDIQRDILMNNYNITSLPMTVIDEGSVTVKNVKRRAIKLQYDYSSKRDVLWVEGIGTKDLYSMLPFEANVSLSAPITEFVACYKDGECIFTAEDFDKYVSDYEINNPGVGITDAETDSEEESSTKWYTIQGIRVTPPLAPGLYIRRCGNRTEKLLIH